MMGKRLSALMLGLGLTLAPAAQAQETESATRSAARSLGMSGVEAYQAGRYDQASDELEKAYGILRAPTLGLWSARALVKQKKLLEAAERYLETSGLQTPTGDTAIQKKAIEDAKSELAALRPTIPSLRIKVVGARASEVQVSIDGVQIASGLLTSPRLVNPGTHEVVGERAGQQVRGSATLSEGQSQDIELRFGSTQAVAAEPSSAAHNPARGPQTAPNEPGDVAPAVGSSRKTWAVVALAAGGAGLVVGGVTGGLAVDLKGELDSSGDCPNGCFTSRQADVDRLNLYRSVSTVGFIAGGVLAATGVVLWVTAPKIGSATARAGLGPTGMVLEGTF